MVKIPLYQLLERQALANPEVTVIAASSRKPLSYAALRTQIDRVTSFLGECGLRHTDRVALVIPDGPEMAVAVLATAICGASAPLNPAYGRADFDFYLGDTGARALIIAAGVDSPAVAVARERGLEVIRLSPVSSAPAGTFTLAVETPAAQSSNANADGRPERDDVALVLHTSGTTGRPKRIPLTQDNLCASARNIAASLNLSPADRCLNVMPLFHVHGLVGGLLATITAGGSIVCTRGFDAGRFFEWMEEFEPTWFTAVPAIHQAILARFNAESPTGRASFGPRWSHLRFIRSCSAALPPLVMAQMEAAFKVPMVEAYGMTEACHQIAVNPLPPGMRKAGSVGRAAGTEIRIVDSVGRALAPGTSGEVAIRGAQVAVCSDGADGSHSLESAWLRTGDIGLLDAEGYLFLRGRIREMINRGGEKIAPREVEEVILQHPAVQEAAVFAVPDARLGEAVAAAVLLRSGQSAEDREIREHVANRLADFKVPGRLVIVNEIPKAATGKVQRANLAEKLGLLGMEAGRAIHGNASREMPRSATAKRLAAIWGQVLGCETVGLHDHFFFDLGGDSLLATEMVLRVEKATGIRVSGASVALRPTVAGLAAWLDSPAASSPVVVLQSTGSETPLFCLHGLSGDVCEFLPLAQALGPRRPVYGLQARTRATQPVLPNLREMAADYIREIRAIQPNGPYILGGHSTGGTIALEVAQQLRLQGETILLLAVFDGLYPGYLRSLPSRSLRQRIPMHLRNLARLDIKEALPYVRQRIATVQERLEKRMWRRRFQAHIAAGRSLPDAMADVQEVHRQMIDAYQPQAYMGRVALFRCFERRREPDLEWDLGWSRGMSGEIVVQEVPGDHGSMLQKPAVVTLAGSLEACLANARRPSAPAAVAAARHHDSRPADVTVLA